MRLPRFRATGAALVTALVIAALTAAAAVAMASRTQLEIARTTLHTEAARRAALVARVEAEIRRGLREDAKTGDGGAIADDQDGHEYSVRKRDITASASVRDEQRLFNLNNLALIPRTSGSRRRSTTKVQEHDAPTPTVPVVAKSGTPPPHTSGQARAGSDAYEQSGSTQAPGDPTTNEHAEPQYVEKTRSVLDPSVAKLVAGRGRPSEIAALVAQTGVPRISETYLERVEPALSESHAEPYDSDVPGTTRADAGAYTYTTGPARVLQSRAGTPNPAASSPQATIANSGSTVSVTADELWLMRFSLLLKRLDISAPIAQAVLDWVDADAEVRFPNGAEDAYYLKLETPYRAANRPFTDVSELLLVRGVTPEVYAKLLPFVTVLPDEAAININTAPAEILMSLAPEIDRRTADLIIAARDVQPFRSADALVALPMLAMTSIDPAGIAVGSEFFTATTALGSGVDVTHSRSLIARARNGRTRIVSRHDGYFDD